MNEIKKIEKVDFDDSESIINYGKSIMQNINNILESTAVLTKLNPEEPVSDTINNEIESLNKIMGVEDNKDENVIINFFNKLLTKMGLKENENIEIDYNKYHETLSRICKIIENQKQNTLIDMDFKKSIISELAPLIGALKDKVEQGKIYNQEFIEEIETLKANVSVDTFNELRNKTKASQLFEDHLFQMAQAVLLYQNQVEGYVLQIGMDENIIKDCDTFLNITSYILDSQGVIRYNLNKKSKQSEFIKNVNNKASDIINDNSKEIEDIKSSLKAAISNIQNSDYQKQKEIEKNNSKLNDILNQESKVKSYK